MRFLVLSLMFALTVSAQSMLEMGAVTAGTAVGSAAGKKVSDGINTNLRKTGKALTKAAKPGTTDVPAPPPALQVSPGVPRSAGFNVPPPPPPARAATPVTRATARTTRVNVPIVMSAVTPPPAPTNVDLTAVAKGMPRAALLTMGAPSSRITMTEDGHLVEIFHYRNATLASGTVRLRDGAVASIEARP